VTGYQVLEVLAIAFAVSALIAAAMTRYFGRAMRRRYAAELRELHARIGLADATLAFALEQLEPPRNGNPEAVADMLWDARLQLAGRDPDAAAYRLVRPRRPAG
jgi:hypothetical protein